MTKAEKFLNRINSQYASLHKKYEELFWISYMGDRSVDVKKNEALDNIDKFRSSTDLKKKAEVLAETTSGQIKNRLLVWVSFFDQYQIPPAGLIVKKKIDKLETKINRIRNSKKEGYIDPRSGKFIPASAMKMRMMIHTHDDESVRKACYEAREDQAYWHLDEFIELVSLRNKFAHSLGYKDFYDYKLQHVDQMTKDQLFSLFDEVREATKHAFNDVRELAKTTKGLRKPWNFSYLTSSSFAREEDQYFQFDQAIDRWGRSFSAWKIDFNDGSLKLDLLDREGKYNNGFCHWPEPVHYVNGKRRSGKANFTCNVVPGQTGAGQLGYVTLFHEGGHAAHFLNCEQKDICLNHEYAPMTAAWAETHSMFLDTAFSSIEWQMRYAKNENDESYPFDLYQRKVKKTAILKPWRMLGIIFTADFERRLYELKNPTPEKVTKLAKAMHRKYWDLSEPSLSVLNIPHLYSWESACSYHGYGLAEMAVHQWRDYFYKKYGYIVDNPHLGKEMRETWKLGASKPFLDCVIKATGKSLSSQSVIDVITMSADQQLKTAKKRLKRMEEVPKVHKTKLKANIKLVHGKRTIATSKQGFDAMAKKYGAWVRKIADDRV